MKAVLKAWLITLTFAYTVFAVDALWADGISGTGAISRFGSIVLNGIHYDTSHAAIRMNGVSATESDLRVGHQVIIETNGISDVADIVNQYDAVRGLISAIHVTDETTQSGEITVMGQTVFTDLDTMFYDGALSDLEIGDAVAIGGTRDMNDNVYATVVEHLSTLNEVVVSGPVSAIDAHSFRIGSLTISTPYIAEYTSEEWLNIGKTVMVKGTLDDDVLTADSVFPIALRATKSIEVFIERPLQKHGGIFYIDGHALVTTADTEFVNGRQRDMKADVPVEVTGKLFRYGMLVATKIEFVETSVVRVDGEVESYDTYTGRVTIGGITATISEDVVMLDRRDRFRHWGPDNLFQGDAVIAVLEQTDNGHRVKRLVRQAKKKKSSRTRGYHRVKQRHLRHANRHRSGKRFSRDAS